MQKAPDGRLDEYLPHRHLVGANYVQYGNHSAPRSFSVSQRHFRPTSFERAVYHSGGYVWKRQNALPAPNVRSFIRLTAAVTTSLSHAGATSQKRSLRARPSIPTERDSTPGRDLSMPWSFLLCGVAFALVFAIDSLSSGHKHQGIVTRDDIH